jgi:hypothetical protein
LIRGSTPPLTGGRLAAKLISPNTEKHNEIATNAIKNFFIVSLIPLTFFERAVVIPLISQFDLLLNLLDKKIWVKSQPSKLLIHHASLSRLREDLVKNPLKTKLLQSVYSIFMDSFTYQNPNFFLDKKNLNKYLFICNWEILNNQYKEVLQ